MQSSPHQHGDGHWADAAGNGGDDPGHFPGLIELDITHQAMAALLGGIRNGVDTDVNDGCTWLDPVAAHHLGFANGGDEDVSLTDNRRQVARAGMTDGHGGILTDQE